MKPYFSFGLSAALIFLFNGSFAHREVMSAVGGDLENRVLSSGTVLDSMYVLIDSGWNIVSIPLLVPDSRVTTLFPTAISQAWEFDGGYKKSDTLQYGKSYWIKFPSNDSFLINGTQPLVEAYSVGNGWNMVSSFLQSISTDSIIPLPDMLEHTVLYSYTPNKGYQITDSIIPGKGYWIRTEINGTFSTGRWESVGLTEETIVSIKTHPSDSNVIFVGSQYNFSEGIPGKLFRSVDQGVSWDTMLIGGSYLDIILNPIHPDTMYTIPFSLYKSIDGGVSWFESASNIFIDPETRLQSLAIDPNNPSILFAGTGGFFGGSLYKSTDAGTTWIDLASNNNYLREGVVSIAINPWNPNIIYVGTPGIGLLLKSTDGGTNWSVTGLGQTESVVTLVQVDPSDSNVVYASVDFQGFYVSKNNGVSWTRITVNDSADGYNGLEFNQFNSSESILSSSLGVYSSKCEQCKWVDVSMGLPHGFSNVVDVSKGNKRLLVGLKRINQNGGVYVWKD